MKVTGDVDAIISKNAKRGIDSTQDQIENII